MNEEKKNQEIEVVYTLKGLPSGKVIEQIQEEKPVVLTLGVNQLLPDFEKNLIGLKTGESFDFVIKADQAYGPSDPYAIFDLPIDTFEEDGKIDDQMIRKGNVIPMTDNEGHKHHGEITAVGTDTVTMDFNHPLAGQDLHFTGKIIAVHL